MYNRVQGRNKARGGQGESRLQYSAWKGFSAAGFGWAGHVQRWLK